MSVSDVNPVTGPEFTPPTISIGGPAGSATTSQQTAETFAAILQAQMDSMIASAALGGLNSGGSGGLLGGSGGLFGGGLGSGLGLGLDGGGLGGGLQSLLLMQTLQPLTEALNKLVERLDRLENDGAGATPSVSQIATPGTLPHRDLIERLAELNKVPAAFLGAVMMAESGGDPRAVGDDGEAVGLFQLHERGMGAGLGNLRYDPELNASIGARGLAEGWHEGLRRGFDGEELVRFAYDFRFNPGGGFNYQGDAIYSYFRFYETLAGRAEGSV